MLSEREDYESDDLLNVQANMMILEKIDIFKQKEAKKISEFRDVALELKTSATA